MSATVCTSRVIVNRVWGMTYTYREAGSSRREKVLDLGIFYAYRTMSAGFSRAGIVSGSETSRCNLCFYASETCDFHTRRLKSACSVRFLACLKS